MALFNSKDQKLIREAIEAAEKQTSGEIRVCVEKKCNQDTLDRATDCFKKLSLDKTAQRNGVLIYIAIDDKKFAILGDTGIHQVVPVDFWHTTKETMRNHFKQNQLIEGIIHGIKMAGEKLEIYFPYLVDDKNELPDDIAFLDEN